jgi:hypothetical protein
MGYGVLAKISNVFWKFGANTWKLRWHNAWTQCATQIVYIGREGSKGKNLRLRRGRGLGWSY